jgi:hypothetical protein
MTLPDRENLKYRKAIRLSRYQDPAGFFIVIVGLDPSSCVTTHNLSVQVNSRRPGVATDAWSSPGKTAGRLCQRHFTGPSRSKSC